MDSAPPPMYPDPYTEDPHTGYPQTMEHPTNEDTNRFLNAKISRKKIELDAMALKNRILLLENEENKVMKKIEETKRRALQIIQIKARNRDHEAEQNEWRSWTAHEIAERHEMVANERVVLQTAVDVQREEFLHETKEKANEMKQNLQVISYFLVSGLTEINLLAI
jgi:hypothetical protein